MEKFTFRIDEDLMDWLENWSDDERNEFENRSDVMRTHAQNLEDDSTYRDAISEFENYDGSFEEFLKEKYIMEETVEKVVETVRKAGEGNYDRAQENVDDFFDIDRDLGWAMHNVVSMYRH